MKGKILVRIEDRRRIPFTYGRGPLNQWVTPEVFQSLINLGFKVEILRPLRKPKLDIVNSVINKAPELEIELDKGSHTTSELDKEPTQPELAPTEDMDNLEEYDNVELEELVEEEETTEDESVEVELDDEEVIEEEEYQEVLVDDENLSADAYYTMDFLTKGKAISILEAREVEHNPNNNAGPLKKLVMDSNPEVEFVE